MRSETSLVLFLNWVFLSLQSTLCTIIGTFTVSRKTWSDTRLCGPFSEWWDSCRWDGCWMFLIVAFCSSKIVTEKQLKQLKFNLMVVFFSSSITTQTKWHCIIFFLNILFKKNVFLRMWNGANRSDRSKILFEV